MENTTYALRIAVRCFNRNHGNSISNVCLAANWKHEKGTRQSIS